MSQKETGMKIIPKSEYQNVMIEVGCYHDEDGNALVRADGKVIGAVDQLIEFLATWKLEADRVKAVPTPAWLEALRGRSPDKVPAGLDKQFTEKSYLSEILR